MPAGRPSNRAVQPGLVCGKFGCRSADASDSPSASGNQGQRRPSAGVSYRRLMMAPASARFENRAKVGRRKHMKVKTLPRRLALPAVVFFFLCILSLSPKNSSYALATVANPHGVAVIIGNRSYGGAGEVKYAHRDADAFRRYVLDVLGFDPENIIDLRDASQAKIVGTFGTADEHRGDLWAWLDPEGGSDVVVYYSGHGMPRFFLMPASRATVETANPFSGRRFGRRGLLFGPWDAGVERGRQARIHSSS